MEFRKCSLCFMKWSPKQRHLKEKIKLEAEIFEQSNVYGATEDDDAINNQLKIIFLLRKILEIPQDQCCTFLVDYGDPCSWMNCCPSCSDLVEKGKILFDQIFLLQNQFKDLQNEIKRTIISSGCEEDKEDDECKWRVQETVRSFISQGTPDLIAPKNDEKAEKTFYSDVNVVRSERQNYFLGSGILNSDVETHIPLSEVEDSPFHISYKADNVTFSPQDPLAPSEKDDVNGNLFVDISDIKKETEEPCYLNENEQMMYNDENGPYNCYFCEKSFTDSCGLKAHESIHTKERPYGCGFCEKRFTNRSNLQEHEIVHTEEKPYQCVLCQKRFKRSNALKRHQLSHTGQKSHQCTFCEKSFAQLFGLKSHERMHTGEKPFGCRFCEKRFTTIGNLNDHERIHTGTKPFGCRFCEKRFTTNGNLNNHERIHTGAKPFGCRFCDKRFSQASNLKGHELRTHTEKVLGMRKIINSQPQTQ